MTEARPWQDWNLHRLAKPAVSLPLALSELHHSALKRKVKLFFLVSMASIFVIFAVLFAVLGIFPGFIDREAHPSFDANAELTLLAVLVGLPIFTGLLILLLIHGRFRRRQDEDDHPWRFVATRDGLEVTSAGGRKLAGPWSEWRYAGYRYMRVKTSRVPTSLVVILGNDPVEIEFSRFRRRDAGQLAAAVLQGLAAAGRTDR